MLSRLAVPPVEVQAARFPDSNPSAKIVLDEGVDVAVGVGVAVGSNAVGVAVGGNAVGVAVGGTGVGVAVGGTGDGVAVGLPAPPANQL